MLAEIFAEAFTPRSKRIFMTIDQDTPVAASQPAADTSSQEVSKPKRTPTARKAKPASKTTAGKSAAKKADSAPEKETSDTTATQAPASATKTSASKTTAAKASSRSAGKTTRAATAKSKKTADATKEISTSAAEAANAQAPAATTDATTSATAPAKSSAKTATSRSASRGTAARKPKTAEAQLNDGPAQTASTVSAAPAEDAQNAPAPKAAKTSRGRTGAAKGRSTAAKSKGTADAAASTAETSAVKSAAEPIAQTVAKSVAATAQNAPQSAISGTAPMAPLADSRAATPTENAPVAASSAATAAAPVEISDKAPERAPRHTAPAARQAEVREAGQSEGQEVSQTAENAETSAAGDAAAGDSPRRKNRRGRRGGRGRNRKKEQGALAAQDADSQANEEALTDDLADDFSEDLPDSQADRRATPLTAAPKTGAPQTDAPQTDAPKTGALDDDFDDDADSLDLDDDLSESARESRPRQAPRQGKPGGRQAEAGKPQGNKPADTAKGPGRGEKAASEAPKGRRRMFISVLPGEQVEVALAEDGQLLEYYLDMLHQRKIKGNIYKGVIHNIDTNLQAAFVSYGAGKNGFLQIDEVHPEYWLAHHEPTKGKKFPPIQKVLKAGQEVLVQVVKEPTGSKGAFLTTWLSLAGRFLVLTPGQDQIGVSRKVDDDDERARLREMMNGIDPGQGLGVIVRTVSAGTTKTTLKNDLQYLKRVWRDIRKKATEVSAPSLIYQEPGLSERAVRDYLTEDVCEIWVDNESVAQSVRETVNLLFPRRSDLVRMHTDMRTPMWERFNLRRQLDQIYSREVLLPSGGRLVFDQTEALMAIDINSGKISGKGNFEAMAHKTNMEAADAIARHLKLRDIGGQVVIDFIEMRDKKHVLEVEKTLRTAMKNDRARHDVSRMSSFGLLELVRQRTGSSALAISLEPCPACGGTGMRRNIEWQALQALRELRRMMSTEPKEKCVFSASPELALYLLNHKRDTLREIEQDYGKCLEIMVRP